MQSQPLNEQPTEEQKKRLHIKVSGSLAQDLLNAYQEELNKQENPPFKEEFLGSYFEDCVSIAANSVLEESDAKQSAEDMARQLGEQQDQGKQLRRYLYFSLGLTIIAGILALIFYKRYKAYA
jgi:hypothetical protein